MKFLAFVGVFYCPERLSQCGQHKHYRTFFHSIWDFPQLRLSLHLGNLLLGLFVVALAFICFLSRSSLVEMSGAIMSIYLTFCCVIYPLRLSRRRTPNKTLIWASSTHNHATVIARTQDEAILEQWKTKLLFVICRLLVDRAIFWKIASCLAMTANIASGLLQQSLTMKFGF